MAGNSKKGHRNGHEVGHKKAKWIHNRPNMDTKLHYMPLKTAKMERRTSQKWERCAT